MYSEPTQTRRAGAPWRRRTVVLAALLSALAVTSALAARPAAACQPLPNTDHCYALAQFETEQTEIASAGSVYIDLGCVGVPNQAENFNNDEMWAGMGAASEEWIEAGIKTGLDYRGGDYAYPGFFAAWKTPGYFEEVDTGVIAQPNIWNNVQLWQDKPANSRTWHAWTYGTGTVTPTTLFAKAEAARELEAGLETTTAEGWNDAAATNLEYEDWSGAWHKGWRWRSDNTVLASGGHGVTPHNEAEPGQHAPFYVGWGANQQNWQFNFGMNWHGC